MKYILIFLSALIAMLINPEPGFSQKKLFSKTDKPGLVPEKYDSSVVAKMNVIANIPLLDSQDNITFIVSLPDTQNIIILKKRQDINKEKRLSWYGEIKNQRGSLVLFSVLKNKLSGYIRTSKGFVYRVYYRGDSVYRIAKYDPSKLDKENEYAPVPIPMPTPDTTQKNEVYCTDSPLDIDVMVVYTSAAKNAAGGEEAIKNEIGLLFDLTNIAYANSDINQRLQEVHIQEINYEESGGAERDLDRLINKTDLFMDEVHDWRNTYSADIVVLIVEDNVFYGYSRPMTDVSVNYESSAFCVVKRTAAANPILAFPHELGHIMGARHDCVSVTQEEFPPNLPYVFSHGYTGSNWETIMSRAEFSKIEYFSNPDKIYPGTGEVTGNSSTTCGANNALTLNTTAEIVSKFRCRPSNTNKVWMRDTWDDTGLEPDPNTATEQMYRSPYIWVRNEHDAGFVHEYDHQNPIAGQANWIYVKMHNSGPEISGNLQIYIASASTGLQWPDDWTKVGEKHITLSSQTSHIEEYTWDFVLNHINLSGHNCMLARWVSDDDPMTFAETENINYNTRQNNNIIWRNMNIVDLSEAEIQTATFYVERKTQGALILEFSDPAVFPDQPFYKTGQVIIHLNNILYNAWKKGGKIGSGIKADGQNILITNQKAVLGNILLPLKTKAKVKLEFRKKSNTIKDKYLFSVEQYEQKRVIPVNDKRKFIGGISYEIFTYKH